MRRQASLVLQAASLALVGASSTVAQDASETTLLPPAAVEARVYPGAIAADGALEMEPGGVATVAVLSRNPDHALVAAFAWIAGSVGEFQLQPEGLLFLAPASYGSLVRRGYAVPPALSGYLFTVKAFATDGIALDESAIVTVRVL